MGVPYVASAIVLAVFLALAAIDGVYLHIWRYRLHTRAASRREHRLHAITAVLFAATLPALFLWETGGLLLWSGVALVAADLTVSVFDMLSERESRADLGGLSTAEHILHMTIMSARGAALALTLGARPAAAWMLDAPWVVERLPGIAATLAWQALPGTAVIAALHLWLCTESGVRHFEALRRRVCAARTTWRTLRCCA